MVRSATAAQNAATAPVYGIGHLRRYSQRSREVAFANVFSGQSEAERLNEPSVNTTRRSRERGSAPDLSRHRSIRSSFDSAEGRRRLFLDAHRKRSNQQSSSRTPARRPVSWYLD